MVKKTIKNLGPLELAVLGVVEALAPVSVAEVQKGLFKKSRKEYAYTTVMTILSRLYEKRVLTREKQGRQYHYSANQKSETSSRSILSSVSRSLFQSKRLQPILTLLNEDDSMSEEDLKKLRAVLDKKIKKKRE